MMGLLVKDMRLIKQQQKRLLILLVPMAIFLNAAMKGDGTFVIGYLTFVCSFMVFASISYDEYENGYTYLMTLPVRRSQFVVEKYLFGILMDGAAWVIGCLIIAGSHVVQNQWNLMSNTMTTAMVILFAIMIFLAISLPLHFQFGSEKGKIVLMVVWGIAWLLLYLISTLAKQRKIDLEQMAGRLLERNMTGAGVLLAVLTALAMVLSVLVSVSIMNKKEF